MNMQCCESLRVDSPPDVGGPRRLAAACGIARTVCIVAAALLALCSRAGGFINPDFTPVHLVKQAEAILVVEFQPPGAKGKAVARVKSALKGTAEANTCTIDWVRLIHIRG